MIKKTYLGDGLYASDDGFMITLTAPRENGDHYVVMEPDVFLAFMLFLEKNRGIFLEKPKGMSC